MSKNTFRGVDSSQEVDVRQLRPDTRRLAVRASAFFRTTDGVIAAMMAVPVLAIVLVKVPFSAEMLLLAMWLFYRMYVDPGHNDPKRKGGKIVRYEFPFRVPSIAKRFDGSVPGNKLGAGITFLGKEISSKLEVWSGDSDLRTHMLVLGTTGSGKTEFLLGLVYNALVQNTGFIYTDGKGAVDLFDNVFRLARYLGREDDLVTINFLTSGRDFLDKQKDRTTNTMNPFALGSSGMLIELIIALMDDSGGGGDMWKGRAIAFVAGLTRALCFLRDRGYLLLDAGKFIEYFELPVVEKLLWDRTITENGHDIKIDDPIFDKVLAPLKAFVLTLPGYKREAKGDQEQKTVEQHGFITMQLTRLFGDLGFTYGYIFQTTLGEVDMYDVVINRRILVVLLPSLERAPDSLKMLGKLIVGAIKQMMAGCLGNRLEGSVREIVLARPTNAKVPFYVVLDEYGYYAVLGFAVAPAQARSLGFPQPIYSLVKLGDGTTKRMGDMKVGDIIRLPNGSNAPVSEVLEHGKLPVSRVHLCNGAAVNAANVHHWPARLSGLQLKLITTTEIAEMIDVGSQVELSRVQANGELEWVRVDKVTWVGIEEVKCLVVDDPLHCYITDHDVVTHNCITFAAQDFSSLQKASKEEADATWENTNVRIVGRITGGRDAETFKRIAGVASDAAVHEVTRKEHESGALMEGYRTVRDTQVTKAQRLEFDDMAQQENGEFTIIVGKKSKGGVGSVRVIRARTFFTQVDERPSDIRVNHFLKIEPPRSGSGDQEMEIIEALEVALKDLLESGKVKEIFPDDPVAMVRNGKPTPLLQIGVFTRELRSSQKLSLGEAIRVSLVCMDREAEIQQAIALQAIEKMKQAAANPESDEALKESVSTVIEAPVDSSVTKADLDDSEFEVPDISMADDFAISATPDGLPKGEVIDEVPALPNEDDKDEGDAAGDSEAAGKKDETGSKSGSGSSSTDMRLTPELVEQVETKVAPSTSAVSVGDAIKGFLDESEFDIPNPSEPESEDAAKPAGQVVSALTFRALGDGEDTVVTDQSAYLQNRISEADMLLGAKENVLEIRNDALETVKELEKATSYVNGAKPEPATFAGVDSSIKALLYAAENGANDFS